MAELTQEVIDIVESTKWSEDHKQDFYVRWLERDEAFVFVNEWHTRKFINQYLAWMRTNEAKKTNNRARLLLENHDTVVNNLALGGEDDDPATITEADEQILINLNSLSAVLKESLILHYIEGRSPEEIAVTLKENVGAVKMRIARARNLLKGEE